MTLRLLIIEDDDIDYNLIERLLGRSDGIKFDFTRATECEDAIIKSRSENFDVVLTDLNLGGRTGLDYLRTLGGAGGAFPIIVLTGFDSPEVEDAVLEAGAADYIEKFSLTRDVLLRSIRYAIRNHKLLRGAHVVDRNRAVDACTGIADGNLQHMENIRLRLTETRSRFAVPGLDDELRLITDLVLQIEKDTKKQMQKLEDARLTLPH